MVLFKNYYGGFFVPTFIQNGTVTSIECETFESYFPCDSEHLYKIFSLHDCP